MASPLPEMTNDRVAMESGKLKEKAWNDGSDGGLISGHTLLRATGLVAPSNIFHFARVATYWWLKSVNPCSENGAGDRNSQAHKAVVGRPKSFKIASTRLNPSDNGSGIMKRTRVMR